MTKAWTYWRFGGDCCLFLRGIKFLTITKLSHEKFVTKCEDVYRNKHFLQRNCFEYVIFQMLTVMAVWIPKSSGCELSVFLSSSPPTTHHFLPIPHFLTSIKHCISFLHITKFLPALFYLFYIIYHHFSVIYFLFLYSCLPYTSEEQSVELTGCL